MFPNFMERNHELECLCNEQAATLRTMQCTINRLETRIESLMDVIAIMEFTQSDTEDQAARAIAALQAELQDKENAFIAMLQIADSMILG